MRSHFQFRYVNAVLAEISVPRFGKVGISGVALNPFVQRSRQIHDAIFTRHGMLRGGDCLTLCATKSLSSLDPGGATAISLPCLSLSCAEMVMVGINSPFTYR